MSRKESDTPNLPWFGIPKLFPYLKKYRKTIFFMVLLGLFASIADSVMPLFTRYAIDHFIGLLTLDTLGIFIALYIMVSLLKSLADFISLTMAGKIEMSVNRDLRNASFSHLQTLSFSYFNQNSVGYIHARVMSDTGKIGELVAWRMMDFVWNASYMIAVLVVMFQLNTGLAGLFLIIIPCAVFLIMYFGKKYMAENRIIREINSRITGGFNEGITGIRSTKTMAVEDVMEEDFYKETLNMKKTSVHAAHYNSLLQTTMSGVGSFALALVLWKGGVLSREAAMEIGTLSVFISYAVGLMEPIEMLVETIAGVISIQANIERFTKLMETESEIFDRPDVIEVYGDAWHPKKENWEELHGDVEFDDVSFRYPDGKELVLDHFSLKIPQGTTAAIVGETGAGKTTLVNLVCRFYEPTEGRVLIDGRDARDRSLLWLHSNIGYVLQTPHLFSGTIRENLRYGKEDATDEEIMAALKLVNADGIVARMDKGLDSAVGEGGSQLSTGEKQLLSFARALLADPRILVLDEATSSVDTMTEKEIQNAISTVVKGRTSFVIAHRLSTVTDADIILVVRDGKIVEQGKHQELMRAKGYYHSLYTRQFEESVLENVKNAG
ncbi:MAG: ABC transporter ATP-binding protein [Solobacterium sp.]|nr:ABC transporter ATP-binding protein [Solobacterium sp.]